MKKFHHPVKPVSSERDASSSLFLAVARRRFTLVEHFLSETCVHAFSFPELAKALHGLAIEIPELAAKLYRLKPAVLNELEPSKLEKTFLSLSKFANENNDCQLLKTILSHAQKVNSQAHVLSTLDNLMRLDEHKNISEYVQYFELLACYPTSVELKKAKEKFVNGLLDCAKTAKEVMLVIQTLMAKENEHPQLKQDLRHAAFFASGPDIMSSLIAIAKRKIIELRTDDPMIKAFVEKTMDYEKVPSVEESKSPTSSLTCPIPPSQSFIYQF